MHDGGLLTAKFNYKIL